jgi:hypothetical protein
VPPGQGSSSLTHIPLVLGQDEFVQRTHQQLARLAAKTKKGLLAHVWQETLLALSDRIRRL